MRNAYLSISTLTSTSLVSTRGRGLAGPDLVIISAGLLGCCGFSICCGNCCCGSCCCGCCCPCDSCIWGSFGFDRPSDSACLRVTSNLPTALFIGDFPLLCDVGMAAEELAAGGVSCEGGARNNGDDKGEAACCAVVAGEECCDICGSPNWGWEPSRKAADRLILPRLRPGASRDTTGGGSGSSKERLLYWLLAMIEHKHYSSRWVELRSSIKRYILWHRSGCWLCNTLGHTSRILITSDRSSPTGWFFFRWTPRRTIRWSLLRAFLDRRPTPLISQLSALSRGRKTMRRKQAKKLVAMKSSWRNTNEMENYKRRTSRNWKMRYKPTGVLSPLPNTILSLLAPVGDKEVSKCGSACTCWTWSVRTDLAWKHVWVWVLGTKAYLLYHLQVSFERGQRT